MSSTYLRTQLHAFIRGRQTLTCCLPQREHWKKGGHRAECAELAASGGPGRPVQIPARVKGSPRMIKALGAILSRPPLSTLPRKLDSILLRCDFNEGEKKWMERRGIAFWAQFRCVGCLLLLKNHHRIDSNNLPSFLLRRSTTKTHTDATQAHTRSHACK